MPKNKNLGVRPPKVAEGFEVISDKEMDRIRRREREYKAMQAKLTRIHAQRRSENEGAGNDSANNYAKIQKHVSVNRRTSMLEAYVHSLLNPFEGAGVRIPTDVGVHTEPFQVKQIMEFPLTTTQFSGSAVGWFPLRWNAMWAFSGTDNGVNTTQVGDSALTSYHTYLYWDNSLNQFETQAFPDEAANTMIWQDTPGKVSEQIWSVDALAPARQGNSVKDFFSHTRTVSSGLRVKYVGKPFDGQGSVAVAMLPPGVAPPRYNNAAGHRDDYMGRAQAFQPNFDDVARLPGARVLNAIEDFEAVILPYDSIAEEFCPTGYVPASAQLYTTARAIGIDAFPPCTSDPEAFIGEANAYITSLQAAEMGGALDPVIYAAGNDWMRNLMLAPSSCFSTIVVAYKNCDPNASIEVEMVSNIEGIPQTNNLTFTGGLNRPIAPAKVQLEAKLARDNVRQMLASTPALAVRPGHSKASGLGSVLRSVAKKAAGLATSGAFGKVVGDISSALGISEETLEGIAGAVGAVGALL